jgi:hypothetical protein
MKYFKRYARSLLRHKWFVFLECCKVGLFWQGIMHDVSKFLPDEFIPYSNFDFNAKRDRTGYYKPTDTGDKEFDFAWLLHQKRNKHHWQWWILPEDNGGIKILEIPLRYRLEMLCDWKGAGKAYGTPNTKEWWDKNKDKMTLHPNTRKWIEEQINSK